MISQEFKNALKLYHIPKYRLAWQAGISPSILNHLINDHMRVYAGDKRILKVARLIGFPEEKIFSNSTEVR